MVLNYLGAKQEVGQDDSGWYTHLKKLNKSFAFNDNDISLFQTYLHEKERQRTTKSKPLHYSSSSALFQYLHWWMKMLTPMILDNSEYYQ